MKHEVGGLVGESSLDEHGKLQYDGSLAQVLAVGGFRFKAINTSIDNDPEARKHLGPVLGHTWDPDTDTISFKFELKSKMQGSRKEETITKDNVDNIKATKRNYLGISSQFFVCWGWGWVGC